MCSKEDAITNLSSYKMKDAIRVDLKLSGLHRDLLRLIRSALKPSQYQPSHAPESLVLKIYRAIL
jgi:hypothetical protein